MSEEKAIALTDQTTLPAMQEITLSPHEVVVIATDQANALMDVVEKKKLYVMIQGKKYLYYEAWETIGQFNGVKAIPDWVNPIKDDPGETIGYTAKVDLLDKCGRLVGSGIMPCYFDEAPCRGKEGSGKHKAAMSAAQTFAGSKAYRMNFAYIAVLGGYEPTPAEEMITEVRSKKTTNPIVDAAKQAGAVILPNTPKLNKKYGVNLDFCWHPDHANADWRDGKFGKSHKAPDGWCNFKNLIKPIGAELGKAKGWELAAMNEEIKKKYDSRTWSKLTDYELAEFLESLME